MTTLLHLDASARVNRSVSRALTECFVAAWCAGEPDTRVIRRDVGVQAPGPVSEAWIDACFTDEAERDDAQRAVLAVSDSLIEELRAADVIVMGTPKYNYGMPSALKAWFDQVIRVNKTFTFDLARGDQPLEPTLSGKTLVLLTSCGEFGFGPGELNDGAGHLIPHVRTCSKYLGVEAFHHIGVEYQEFGDARHESSKRAAFDAIPRLVEALLAEDSLRREALRAPG